MATHAISYMSDFDERRARAEQYDRRWNLIFQMENFNRGKLEKMRLNGSVLRPSRLIHSLPRSKFGISIIPRNQE